MGGKDKLVERFLRQPKDFTFSDLVKPFKIFGFILDQKYSGSRVKFINKKKDLQYRMHRPHPSNYYKNVCDEASKTIFINAQICLTMGSVEYNAQDGLLFGKVEGMSKHFIAYQGKSIEELQSDFQEAIDDYLEDCQKQEKKQLNSMIGKNPTYRNLTA